MNATTSSHNHSRVNWLPWLLGVLALAGLVILYREVVRPFFLQITDQAGPFYLTFNPADLDLDGDEDLDALVVGKRRAALWWNVGQGKFTRGDQSLPCSENEDLTTGDFNGDGQTDIFVARYGKSAQVWMNDGQGNFRVEDR